MGFFDRNPDIEFKYFLQFLVFLGILVVVALYMLVTSGDYRVLVDAWRIIKNLWWIILPYPIWLMYMRSWGEYRMTEFRRARGKEYIWLQVLPPNDIEKGPRAMESVFTGMHTWSKPNFLEVYCGWRMAQSRYSFDIVGDGEHGARFILQIPKYERNLIESLIYAHYPESEIREIENYKLDAPKDIPNKEWDLWGTTLNLLKDDCIPLRTYREFKDEITGEAIDPLASLMEVISKLGKNERLWYQVIFSPKNEPDWVPQANKKMKDIITKFIEETGGNMEDGFNINKLPPGEQDVVKAIKNSLSRVAYKSTLRFIYFGKRNQGFNKATGVAGTMSAVKSFNDNNLNSLLPDNRTKTFANYHFQAARLRYRQRKIFNDFKGLDRTGISYTFTAEELALIYHFPVMHVKATALNRVEAKKSSAPSNLPFEEDES